LIFNQSFHSEMRLSDRQAEDRRAFLLKFPVKYASKQISVMSISPWIHHSHWPYIDPPLP
jgi:hypothetical protein